MRICESCKHENEENSRFCESCGSTLEQPTSGGGVIGSCPACHEPVAPGSRFCTRCGQKLSPPREEGADSQACPACDAPVMETDYYCGRCGTGIDHLSPGEATDPIGVPVPVSVEGARLLVLAGREKDRVYSLGREVLTIGRARDNDVSTDTDCYVSNVHARILYKDGSYYVEDADSINGTFLKVRGNTHLSHGDELKIGQSLLRFESGNADTD